MRRLDLRRWVVAVLMLFALRAVPAHADAAAADALIQEGLKLRREGKPEDALEKFRQAHEMAPSPRTYGQMGLVEASLRRWTDSETHLAVALANPDDAWVRKNRAFLDQALSLCREHVGDLIITGPPGVEISVGGASVGTLPNVPALRVAEGDVEVSATGHGYEPFTQKVTIRPKARASVKIAMVRAAVADVPPKEAVQPLLPPPPPPPPPPPLETNQSHWRGWTALSLGVAGVGAAAWGITWIAIDGRCKAGHTVQDYPTRGAPEFCSEQTSAPFSDHNLEVYDTKLTGVILTAAGGAALAAAAVVYFTRPSDTAAVAVSASPGAIWLAGRF